MRINLTYACGCVFALDLEPWGRNQEGELRVCHAHSHPSGEAGRLARRLLSVTYHKEGGGD